jgi:hypothetical protein
MYFLLILLCGIISPGKRRGSSGWLKVLVLPLSFVGFSNDAALLILLKTSISLFGPYAFDWPTSLNKEFPRKNILDGKEKIVAANNNSKQQL